MLFAAAGCADRDTNDSGSSRHDRDDYDEDDEDDDGDDGSLDRYKTQEKYTKLMDAANTISNNTSSAISDGNQIGAIGDGSIIGIMEKGTLTIRFNDAYTLEDGYISSDMAQDKASDDTALARAAKGLHASLVNDLPDGATFFIKYEKSAVYGVIYSDDPDNPVTWEVNVYIVEDYDDAYEGFNGNPLGVSGYYTSKLSSKEYTVLQNAAKSISNASNNAFSDANQIGVITTGVIIGNMENGTLTIRFNDAFTLKDGYITSNKAQDNASDDNALARAAKRLHASLVNDLPDGATFFVKYEESAVYGVIYSDDPDNVITGEVDIYMVTDYNDAYEDAKHNPLGVAGKYVPE